MGTLGLGDPISLMQFTTLENTPPEFLILGSTARQSYASDTFPLGLSYLHLLTGYEPYEEMMSEVTCPLYLLKRLTGLWTSSETVEDCYYVVKQVVLSLDNDDSRQGDDDDSVMDSVGGVSDASASGSGSGMDLTTQTVLCDTLYRYMVLFAVGIAKDLQEGIGSSEGIGSRHTGAHTGEDLFPNSPVWYTLVDALGLYHQDFLGYGDTRLSSRSMGSTRSTRSSPGGKVGKGGPTKGVNRVKKVGKGGTKADCLRQFREDIMVWSVHMGSHPRMLSTRARLHSLGDGSLSLLESMVHLDPVKRCSMLDAMKSSIFHNLCSSSEEGEGEGGEEGERVRDISFMHYYRPTSLDSLPNL